MKQFSCHVVENRALWANVQLLTLAAPDLRAIRPTQFALARAPTLEPYLRRTLWLYRVEGAHIAFTLPARDPLAARARPGDVLDLLAPLGRAVEFDANARRVVLIGEGARAAPLLALAQAAVAQGREVVLAARAAAADAAAPAHLLAPEIEYRTESEALSAELLTWADAVVASGSDELYDALADAVRTARYHVEPGFARVLLDAAMPCGVGMCYACAVETARGLQRACVEGPAFDLTEFDKRRPR